MGKEGSKHCFKQDLRIGGTCFPLLLCSSSTEALAHAKIALQFHCQDTLEDYEAKAEVEGEDEDEETSAGIRFVLYVNRKVLPQLTKVGHGKEQPSRCILKSSSGFEPSPSLMRTPDLLEYQDHPPRLAALVCPFAPSSKEEVPNTFVAGASHPAVPLLETLVGAGIGTCRQENDERQRILFEGEACSSALLSGKIPLVG